MRNRSVYALAPLIVLLFVAGCPVKQQRPLELRATPQHTNTQTEFSIVGSGFTPDKTVSLNLMFEPGRSISSYEIRTITADPLGNFTTYYAARYLPGPNTGTQNPSFVARDNTTGQTKVATVLRSHWYPYP